MSDLKIRGMEVVGKIVVENTTAETSVVYLKDIRQITIDSSLGSEIFTIGEVLSMAELNKELLEVCKEVEKYFHDRNLGKTADEMEVKLHQLISKAEPK